MARPWIEALWRNGFNAWRGPQAPALPWWKLPAIGQLTVTRWELLEPFSEYNELHPEGTIRPGGFIAVAYPKSLSRAERPRLIAPFCSPREALDVDWYEVASGEAIRITTDDLV